MRILNVVIAIYVSQPSGLHPDLGLLFSGAVLVIFIAVMSQIYIYAQKVSLG